MASVVWCLFLSVLLGGVCARPYVVPLSHENFENLMSKGPWVVRLYFTWDGHAKAATPHYDKAAEALRDEVRFGKVNCEEEKALCKHLDISTYNYPNEVYYINGNQQATYRGSRIDANELVAWARAPNMTVHHLRTRVPDLTVEEIINKKRLADATEIVIGRYRSANVPLLTDSTFFATVNHPLESVIAIGSWHPMPDEECVNPWFAIESAAALLMIVKKDYQIYNQERVFAVNTGSQPYLASRHFMRNITDHILRCKDGVCFYTASYANALMLPDFDNFMECPFDRLGDTALASLPPRHMGPFPTGWVGPLDLSLDRFSRQELIKENVVNVVVNKGGYRLLLYYGQMHTFAVVTVCILSGLILGGCMRLRTPARTQ